MSTPKRANRSLRHAVARSSGRWFVAAVITVVVVAGLAYGALRESRDPRFTASIGPISGLAHTSREQVIRAADLPLTQNAWLIDRRAVSRRIERLPWVRTARLSVRWPNKLRIDVTERNPVALVVLAVANGEEPVPAYALIDDSQRVLQLSAGRSETETLPLLIVSPPPQGAIQPGSSLTTGEVRQALQALARLRALGLQVSEVAIAPATGISAMADRNLRVLFGENEDLAKKAAVFQAIVAKISEPSRIAYIDVRSVRAPTVLYR